MVPHFGRDEAANDWLRQCLQSLLGQSVSLAQIVVVDDASPCAPDAVLASFPSVSLYRSVRNVGPFALLDTCFARLRADGFLMQDSDDWSHPERLQRLLDAARRHRAELVGCQVRQAVPDAEGTQPIDYPPMPPDPRASLIERPDGHPMMLATALVSSPLLRRLDGLSSGLRLSGDAEFLRRALLVTRAVNIPDELYVRRVHAASLTQHPDTGIRSESRRILRKRLRGVTKKRLEAFRRGAPMDLSPLEKATPPRLEHVLGPRVL